MRISAHKRFPLITSACFAEIEHVRLKNAGNVYWQFLSHELNTNVYFKPNVYFYVYKDHAS